MRTRGFVPRSARVGRSLRGAFIYDGGSQKTLTIYWASPNRLSFLLCPQTPDFAFCEAKARPFNLIPGGYGGRSERHQGAEGPLVLSERSPPIENQTPAERMSHMRGAAWKSTRALSLRRLSKSGAWGAQRASPRGRRHLGVKRAKPPIENQTPAERMSHMRGAASKSPRALSTYRCQPLFQMRGALLFSGANHFWRVSKGASHFST